MSYSDIPTTSIRGSGTIYLDGFGKIRASGSAEISPDSITTSGSSTLPGGLSIGRLITRGSTRVRGDIQAEEMKFRGSVQIDGDCNFETLDKAGSMNIDGSVKGTRMAVAGSTKIRGLVELSEEMRSKGSIKFGDDLLSEGLVRVKGGLGVDGQVRADTFEMVIGNDESRVMEGITANIVEIRLPETWHTRGVLRTTDIAGKNLVDIESVECDNVTGGKIIIRQGCRINGKVTYHESIQVHPKAHLTHEPEKLQ